MFSFLAELLATTFLGFGSISPKFGTERLKTKMDEKNIPSEYNKALKV